MFVKAGSGQSGKYRKPLALMGKNGDSINDAGDVNDGN
jgi:hypothetical protein